MVDKSNIYGTINSAVGTIVTIKTAQVAIKGLENISKSLDSGNKKKNKPY